MPALVLFKNRWTISSDDFVLISFILSAFHILCIILLSIRLSIHSGNVEDSNCGLYICGYIAALAICIFCQLLLALASAQGGIFDDMKRKSVPKILYIRLVLECLKLLYQIFGFVTICFSLFTYLSLDHFLIAAIIFMDWIFFVLILLKFKKVEKQFIYNTYSSISSSNLHNLTLLIEDGHVKCNSHCNFCFPNWNKKLFVMLGLLLRDLDLVESDCYAGFLLLQQKQIQQTQKRKDIFEFLSGTAIRANTKFVNIQDPSLKLNRLLSCSKLVEATFSLLNSELYLCALNSKTMQSRCCRKRPSRLNFENCLQKKLERLILNKNIIILSLSLKCPEASYWVGVDTKEEIIIFTIFSRGCLKKLLQDVLQSPSPTSLLHIDCFAHSIYVEIAERLLRDINQQNIFGQISNNQKWSSYSVIVTGHGRCAAIASIIAILLKQIRTDVHCYAFAPPNPVLNESCSHLTKGYITSIVVGKDIIPRLGLPQLRYFREDILKLLQDTKKKKYQILAWQLCKNDQFFDDETVNATPILNSMQHSLTLPGRVLQVVTKHVPSVHWLRGSERIVQLIEINSKHDLASILASPRILLHHHPHHIALTLSQVMTHVSPAKPARQLTNKQTHSFETSLSQDGAFESFHVSYTSNDIQFPNNQDTYISQYDSPQQEFLSPREQEISPKLISENNTKNDIENKHYNTIMLKYKNNDENQEILPHYSKEIMSQPNIDTYSQNMVVDDAGVIMPCRYVGKSQHIQNVSEHVVPDNNLLLQFQHVKCNEVPINFARGHCDFSLQKCYIENMENGCYNQFSGNRNNIKDTERVNQSLQLKLESTEAGKEQLFGYQTNNIIYLENGGQIEYDEIEEPAPLASPESVSDVSSLQSCFLVASESFKRASRLDAIEQSPLSIQSNVSPSNASPNYKIPIGSINTTCPNCMSHYTKESSTLNMDHKSIIAPHDNNLHNRMISLLENHSLNKTKSMPYCYLCDNQPSNSLPNTSSKMQDLFIKKYQEDDSLLVQHQFRHPQLQYRNTIASPLKSQANFVPLLKLSCELDKQVTQLEFVEQPSFFDQHKTQQMISNNFPSVSYQQLQNNLVDQSQIIESIKKLDNSFHMENMDNLTESIPSNDLKYTNLPFDTSYEAFCHSYNPNQEFKYIQSDFPLEDKFSSCIQSKTFPQILKINNFAIEKFENKDIQENYFEPFNATQNESEITSNKCSGDINKDCKMRKEQDNNNLYLQVVNKSNNINSKGVNSLNKFYSQNSVVISNSKEYLDEEAKVSMEGGLAHYDDTTSPLMQHNNTSDYFSEINQSFELSDDGEQQLYDEINGHYSNAGRGYPHGHSTNKVFYRSKHK